MTFQKETIIALHEIINDIPMLKSFSEEEKKEFAESTFSFQKFNKGEAIIKEGDAFTALYLLIDGSVLVTKTKDKTQIRLAKLKSGEIFGEMSLFSKKPRQSNVIANEKVLAVKMDENFFEKTSPFIKDKIKNYFLEILINRLDIMNESIMNISKLMHA